MSEATWRRMLRAFAVAIAVAAVLDPAITSRRSARPIVVVSALDSASDASLADRVARSLNNEFTVARSPVAGASAAVVVGDRVPDARDDYPTPAFAVTPDSTAPRVSIERVDVPAVVPSEARVPVMVQIAVRGAAGRSLDVTLRAGASVAEHTTRRITNDGSLSVALSFVPTAIGATPVRVTAAMGGATAPAIADVAASVKDRRWTVLFFDPRPSWTSTFVRRAIERDPRVVVTSRVVTSRNVSTDAGRPPGRLDDLAVLSAFDAIVVGAPEGLSPADVAGLEAFMRRRGGSVVLLLDQRAAGAYDRLTGVAQWSSSTTPSTFAVPGRDSATLRGADAAWPSVLPPGATTIAGGARPVVWESRVGAGRLIVSGALDAWRFRDPSSSGFDEFWRRSIAEAASASPPPVAVSLSPSIAAPGEMVDVHAAIRDAALQPSFTTAANGHPVQASISAATVREPFRLWPEPDAGQFRGRVRAPRAPGVYQISVTGNGATSDVQLVVADDVRRAAPSAPALLGAWATAHGGQILRETEIERLPAALRAAVRPSPRVETWHPMRSAWWILPFALALSGEWLLRRRRGLR